MLALAIPQLLQAAPGHPWERIHPFSEDQKNVYYCLMSTNMFISLNFMYLNIILIYLKLKKSFGGREFLKVSFFLNLLVLHTWLFKIKFVILIMRNDELNLTAPTYGCHTSQCSLSHIFFPLVFPFSFILTRVLISHGFLYLLSSIFHSYNTTATTLYNLLFHPGFRHTCMMYTCI